MTQGKALFLLIQEKAIKKGTMMSDHNEPLSVGRAGDSKDYFAQRTYDESGDYSVNPFIPSIHNSLNDRLGNNGIFFDTEGFNLANNI